MRRVPSLLAAALLVTVLSPLATSSAVGSPPHDSPVTPADRSFPDPFVIRVGSTWYAYGTDGDLGDVQIMTSPDLETWTGIGHDGLGTPPSFAQPDDVWAPAVLVTASDYVLYNAYVQKSDGVTRCIGITASDDPAGPFDAVSDDCFVSVDASNGGVIDPSVFTTNNGTHYLLWKTEGVVGMTPPKIWIRQLSGNGRSLIGTATPILASDQPWEGTLVENPFLAEDGGHLYLFYSGNEWKTDAYAVGWAACASVTGPCVKPPNRTLLHTESPNFAGPGGGSVFQDETGQWWFAFAAWNGTNTSKATGERGLYLRRLKFIDGRPYLETAEGSYATSDLVARIAGPNRYDTAAMFSANTVQAQRPVTYVATGESFPDALAAAPASGSEDSPVLLVTHDSIGDATRAELARVSPGHIVAMGGTGAISDAVYAQLSPYSNNSIHRESGINRYHTASLVSRNTFQPGAVAYIANGEGFPDALGGGAAGAANHGPLLLVTRDSVPQDTATELGRLQPSRIVILGGTGAVSNAVAAQIAHYGPITRIAGNNRDETAALLARAEFAGLIGGVVIATGQTFPDAVAAGAAGYPVLLVPSTGPAPQVVKDALNTLKPLGIIVMGGTGAVSQATLQSLGL